jgi:nucleotide-binding universal stress UspA family protein
MRLHDAELLIVGLHGKKGLSDLLLTNTMARVVASIGGPTLIAKTSPPLPYRNIVVGIDFAETAAAALARAQRWFPEARICVVHAFDLRFGRRPPGPVSIQELDEQRRHWLAETVARAGAPARGQPVETLLMNGPPAQMLRKAAVDRQSDLIVLGRHNRGWLLDAILGSVVRTVLADPPCDVLVVAPEPAKAASRGA